LRATRGEVPFAAGYGAEAERVAAAADVVIVMIGLPPADESEGYDRTHMNLPADQLAGLKAVAAVNPNIVVVLVNGSTVLLGEVLPHARALVEAWLGGQGAGGAIADVLTGTVNPSGRLAETVPHRLQDNPSLLNFPGDSQVVRYGEGLFIGYRGYDACQQEVAFPFGFGLSYTTFTLSDLDVTTRGSVTEGTFGATVSLTVTNTGTADGAEVVQVYVRDVDSSVARPIRELKGFTKVFLTAGTSRRVSVELDQRAFAFWSPRHGTWTVEAGEFTIEAGPNSRELPLRASITVEAPSIAAALTRDSTLHEWMADPLGRQLLEREAANGRQMSALSNELIGVIGTMPMSTLANFGGLILDHDTLDHISEEWRRRA
jgi:beta-glucosidase